MTSSPEYQLHTMDESSRPQSPSQPISIPNASSSYRASHPWDGIDYDASPGYAYTPSYQGSFNSFSSQPDPLLNWGGREEAALQNPSQSSVDVYDSGAGDIEYNPQDYDGDQNSPFLLLDDQVNYPNLDNNTNMLFNSNDALGNQISFAAHEQSLHPYSPRPDMYNAPSPASSIGHLEPTNDKNRSRASSVSSALGHPSPGFNQSLDLGQNPPSIHDEFQRLNMDYSNENNNWQSSSNTLPSINAPTLELQSPTSPGGTKPISPPQLMIPGDSLMPPQVNLGFAPVPGPNSLGVHPAINIMPATPVSGGGAAGGPNVPFQQVLHNLNNQRKNVSQSNSGNGWFFFPLLCGLFILFISYTPVQSGSNRRARLSDSLYRANFDPSEATLPSISAFASNNGASTARVGLGQNDSTSSSNEAVSSWSLFSASGQSQGAATASALPSRSYHHGYNIPAIPSFQQHQTLTNAPSFHHANTAPQLSTTSDSSTSMQNPQYSLGSLPYPPFDTSSYLSPPQQRSRSKSDTSTRPPAWSLTSPSGYSSSTVNPIDILPDISTFDDSPSFGPFDVPIHPRPGNNFPSMEDSLDLSLSTGEASLRRAYSDGGSQRAHKRNVKSEDWSSRSPRLGHAQQSDYIRSVKNDGLLAPVDPRSPPPNGLSGSSGTGGPTRRRGSSGANGHERTSSLSSLRSSPYSKPSPHATPSHSPSASPHIGPGGLPILASTVERQLVTTPATKTASANRRRAEATFTCPVEGCGSTFTRHFNLRGHMRSHNEERPFKCKWEGCEKGFARQHDCKRHEALHLNIRPYTCEGCQKNFARMDALNRHRKSFFIQGHPFLISQVTDSSLFSVL